MPAHDSSVLMPQKLVIISPLQFTIPCSNFQTLSLSKCSPNFAEAKAAETPTCEG